MLNPASLPEHAHNLGFWYVDDTMFFNKTKAIHYATLKNTHNLRYYYWDHVYENYDWTIEPTQTLEQLYIERARQLRNQYDYLVLLYSGGSDSSNALKSFFYNNIKLDEVAYWYTSVNEETNVHNYEIRFAASEMLQKLIDSGVTVTGIDDAQYIRKHTLKKHEWILESDPTTIIITTHRPQTIYDNPKWRKIADSGKRVGVIIGYEKPRVFYDGENWQFAFLDGLGYNYEKYHLLPTQIQLEPFYISPNFPLLPIKQSHVLKNYLLQNYTLEDCAKLFTHRSSFEKDLYYQIVRNVLYPYWNDNTFTIGKQKDFVHCKKCEWVWNSNTELSQNFFSGLDWVNENVNEYFLNDGDVYKGIKGNWSRWYRLNG